MALADATCEVRIEAFDDINNALWNAICSQNLPVNTVKRFLIVVEIYVQLPIPLSTLLKNIP